MRLPNASTQDASGARQSTQAAPFSRRPYVVRTCDRESNFVDKIVERRPCSGDALFSQKPGCILNSHAVRFDGFVLAPEVGEFRNDGADRFVDDGFQLRWSSYNYGMIHNFTLFNDLTFPAGRADCSTLIVQR